MSDIVEDVSTDEDEPERLIEEAREAVFALRLQQRKAQREGSFSAAAALKKKVNRAQSQLAQLEVAAARGDVDSADEQLIDEISAIKAEIDAAADAQAALAGGIKLIGFFAQLLI